MPTILPIQGAGTVVFEETVTNVYCSYGSLRVLASPEYPIGSDSAFEITGEGLAPALGGHDVRGVIPSLLYGSIDTGTVPDSGACGALDEGEPSFDPTYGAADIAGEGYALSRGSLEVGAENSLSGSIDYRASASLEPKSLSLAAALSAYGARKQDAHAARASASLRHLADAPASASLEAAGTYETALPAQASLETGNPVDAEAKASADIQNGEGVDFIVDIQDVILSSGHGDC